jgi:hypothetical protein
MRDDARTIRMRMVILVAGALLLELLVAGYVYVFMVHR